MLDTLFLAVLNKSITASFVILSVLLVRLFLRKAPKIFSYALWTVVLFRLICPFTFESAIGLLPVNATPIPREILYSAVPQINTGFQIVDQVVNPLLPAPANLGDSVNPLQIWIFVGSSIWVVGMLMMLIYSAVQFVRLRRKLVGATPLRDHIYLADHTGVPFVLGFIKPKIYLPSSMTEAEQKYIMIHEQCHIKRFDHIARILAFTALMVHWFNPLVWLAFRLSGRDMEMSCDEAVMKSMDHDIRAEYSQSLLRFATGRRIFTATPLAFGEGGTKDRIRNVMKYKKPMLWVTAAAVIVVTFVAAGLAANQKVEEERIATVNDIWAARTQYVGDSIAVGTIISGLSFPEKLEYAGFELDTAQPPFGITVNLATDAKPASRKSLERNAIIMFSLIENADLIHFRIDDGKNPHLESFYRESAQAVMGEDNLFAATETFKGYEELVNEIPARVSQSVETHTVLEPDVKYKTEAEFLNHPDGVKFQATAFRAAKAYLSGDTGELAEIISENCIVDVELDLFKDIDYMILKWSLDNIKAEDKIDASYQFLLKGEDSASYVTMELVKIDSEWKVDFIGLEK